VSSIALAVDQPSGAQAQQGAMRQAQEGAGVHFTPGDLAGVTLGDVCLRPAKALAMLPILLRPCGVNACVCCPADKRGGARTLDIALSPQGHCSLPIHPIVRQYRQDPVVLRPSATSSRVEFEAQ